MARSRGAKKRAQNSIILEFCAPHQSSCNDAIRGFVARDPRRRDRGSTGAGGSGPPNGRSSRMYVHSRPARVLPFGSTGTVVSLTWYELGREDVGADSFDNWH